MKALLGVICLLMAAMGAWAQADGGVEEVESGMTLQLNAPILAAGERKFMLYIRTNDVYPCANYSVEYTKRVKGKKMTVVVTGIRRNQPCEPGMGPAVGAMDLSDFDIGTYKMLLIINRQFFKGTITVDSTYFDLTMARNVDPLLVRIYNGRLNMIPGGTLWGKCEYTEERKKALAERFMADLEKAGARKTALPPGNYDEFYLHQPGAAQPKSIKGEAWEYPFVFSYIGGMEPLLELANGYRSDLKITLKNDKGVVMRNW
ncbi:MAG: hypothetical protein U0176_06870 [Bacteroidia bacterium]